jgi:hypothetical protein
MTNIWIHQDSQFGLGNFINISSTIRMMADHLGGPIPVYFDLKFVEECFLDCPFIEILEDRPEDYPLFGSNLVNYKNDCPDWLYVYKQVTKRFPLSGDIPHTYVDEAKEIDAPHFNTLFIRGSGSEDLYYCSLKMPHDDYYKEYFAENLAGNYTQAFTGSVGDIERANGLFDDMPHFLGGIRLALALIREADYIVCNDSGLAHAAAAMRKPMTILWKNTSLPKNANPNPECKIKMCH